METGRRNPSRKVREISAAKKEEPKPKKASKKNASPANEVENVVPNKKQGKKPTKEEPTNKKQGKKPTKEEPKLKLLRSRSVEPNKKQGKKPTKEEPKLKLLRRSQSVEPETTRTVATKKGMQDDVIPEELPKENQKGKKRVAARQGSSDKESHASSKISKIKSKHDAIASNAGNSEAYGARVKSIFDEETDEDDIEDGYSIDRIKKTPASQASGSGSKKEEASSSHGSGKLKNEGDQLNEFGIKEKFNRKILSWNVAGLRALMKKNSTYFEQENADVICLIEVKFGSEKDVPAEVKLDGYHAYWNIATGAPGVGLLTKEKPLKTWNDMPESKFSADRRMITAEYKDFYLVACYVVNAGRALKTLDKRLNWNEVFDNYVHKLDKKKPVIIAGDMNVSHQEIDLANPGPNKKNAGFTKEERDGFTHLLSLGFVDSFRHFHPDQIGAYTFWTYLNNSRSKNVGWRLDYFLVSRRFMKHVKASFIRSTVLGSDHCPIVLFLNL